MVPLSVAIDDFDDDQQATVIIGFDPHDETPLLIESDRVLTFPVATQLLARTAGRPTAIVNTPTGTMRVSTVEATVLDLVSAPPHSGGLSNVATVIGDLLEDSKLEPSRLAAIAHLWPTAVVQRTGWIIQQMGDAAGVDLELDALAAIASTGGRLVPSSSDGPLDSRWKVVVNAQVEPDR